MILVLAKPESCRAPKLAVGVLSHLDDLMFGQNASAQDVMMSRHIVVMKLPNHSCGLQNNPNSFRGGMFKLNAKFHAGLLLYLLSHLAFFIF